MRIDFGDSSSMSGAAAVALKHARDRTPAFELLPASDLDLVRRYGGPVSHAALNPRYRSFRFPGIDGMVSFMLDRRCAVVMGDPICAPAQRAELASAFARYCANNNWSTFHVIATEEMQRLALKSGGGAIQIADLLIANPQNDPEAGSKASALRRNINRCRRENVKVFEYQGNWAPNADLEARAEAALASWRANRKGFQMYLAPRIFADRPGCRWFMAERDGAVVGLLFMMRVNCGGCRYLIDLAFSTPDAPRHANELLVVTAFKALREEGEQAVCLGAGPRAELGTIAGFGPLASAVARWIYRMSEKTMPQHNKTIYWEKYGVVRREPLYLLFQRPHVGIREIRGLLKAFNFSMKEALPKRFAALLGLA